MAAIVISFVGITLELKYFVETNLIGVSQCGVNHEFTAYTYWDI